MASRIAAISGRFLLCLHTPMASARTSSGKGSLVVR
jgi:hypothetical protein